MGFCNFNNHLNRLLTDKQFPVKKLRLLFACTAWMLTILSCYSQTNTPKKEVKLFFEKIYLHTDRQVYTPGDDLWFKGYLTNAQDGRLIATSKNLYVELIGPANNLLGREIIALNNGLGKGDIQIPDSIAAGNYRLRAYTNWMRNFGNNFIFEKSITIVNGKPAVASHTTAKEPVIRFFPEGGSLIAGVSSVVAIKAESSAKKGLAVKGVIFSSGGDTVANFTTDTLGMGMFTLLPMAGQKYQAKVTVARKTITTTLPAPLNSGLALKMLKKDTILYAIISCSEQASAQYTNQTLTLKARSFGRVTFQQTLQLKGNTAAVIIPTAQLPGGISSLTLYDAEQKPNCERLIFVNNFDQINLKVTFNKSTYTTREQVQANVILTDKKGQALGSNFSMSAVDATLVAPEEANIASYLLLQSELKGEIAYAAKYFDTTNVQRFKQLDLLLMTQGWRDFVWKRLADTALRIAYIPEQGLSISGKVQGKKNIPLPGANITLIAAKATNGRLFSAQTDATGKYYFDNLQLYGPQSIRLNSKDAKGKALGTLTLDSLNTNRPPVESYQFDNGTPVQLSANNTVALIRQVTQAKQRSLSDTLIRLKEVQVKNNNPLVLRDRTVTTFGYKDEVLKIKPEDLRYNTLRDYIQFASTQARVDAESNRLYFVSDGKKLTPRFVLNNRDALFTDSDPAEVADMISSSYLDLPVSSVDQVVIKKLIAGQSLMVASTDSSATPSTSSAPPTHERFNNSAAIGPVFVIYLTLKPDAFKKPEPGAIQAEVMGYYEARDFYKPMYNQPKNDTRVDSRATLHWEPNGSTVQNGRSTISYYNSDSKTTVRVVVQGITTTGIPFTAVKTYTVK